MSLGVVITTCKHYFPNIDNLLREFEVCEFPKDRILVVSGQEDTTEQCSLRGVRIQKVPYTCLHLTGVKYVHDNMEQFPNIEYWVVLPDTISVGPKFCSILQQFLQTIGDTSQLYAIPFVHPAIRPTMDMGILTKRHIRNMGDYLEKIQRMKYNDNTIRRLKKQLIFDENTILGLDVPNKRRVTSFQYRDPHFSKQNIRHFLVTNQEDIRVEGVQVGSRMCKANYFPTLDFVKYQRNFNGSTANIVMEL